jgi:hypothetical protein
MVGCMPFLAIVGVVLAKLTTSMTAKISAAYSDANAIAQQSIAQIRTVAAYHQEDAAAAQYEAALRVPLQVRGTGAGGLARRRCCAGAPAWGSSSGGSRLRSARAGSRSGAPRTVQASPPLCPAPAGRAQAVLGQRPVIGRHPVHHLLHLRGRIRVSAPAGRRAARAARGLCSVPRCPKRARGCRL